MALFGIPSRTPTPFTPPGCDEPVYLLPPSTADYVRLVREGTDYEGKVPPAEYVAKVVLACLVDAEGNRIAAPGDDSQKRKELLAAPPQIVMAIYRHCWATALNAKAEAVAAREGN
jgi:hypothetical protein